MYPVHGSLPRKPVKNDLSYDFYREPIVLVEKTTMDFSHSSKLVDELIQTKEQVDKIIRYLLRTLPDFQSKDRHQLPDLASSFTNLNTLLDSLPEEPVRIIHQRTRAHSWPPACLGSYDTLLTRVEFIAFKILQTSVISMIDTGVTAELMKSLQTQLEYQKNLTGDHKEADALLAKLLYIFAPLLRLTEALVRVSIVNNFRKRQKITYIRLLLFPEIHLQRKIVLYLNLLLNKMRHLPWIAIIYLLRPYPIPLALGKWT